jgi:glutaredoxin
MSDIPTFFIIFGREQCHFCNLATSLLEDYFIEYQYFHIDELRNNPVFRHLLFEVPPSFNTVPQCFVGSRFLGGYNGLLQYLENS